MLIEIAPLARAGAVHLGMTRDEVRAALPEPPEEFRKDPASEHPIDAFCDASFQVFYVGSPPRVEFIELSSDPELTVLLDGLDVFRTPADEVIRRVSSSVPFDAQDPELGYSYVFPQLELAFWRASLPESADDDEGRHFDTVALGVKGYFSADDAGEL